MAYTALARRYRSQSFDDVVGQEPIAQTLKSAIASDRLHHAYLFTGTRGVGKTSMARIFARALNAPDTIDGCPRPKGAKYPDQDVQQRMAEAIMRGEDMNVIEIDGASNRGVDDARQLIANAGLAPTGNARFKIYIIDEVHMLTREAFNALLKTMEEPPSHLKFILCTTEPHKVLPTIHSRCQRFDFRNIPSAQIVEHLRNVVKKEKIKAEDSVLFQVARLGNGSMRDALSLLDRLLAVGEDLTPGLLEKMLGIPDRQVVASLVQAIAASEAGSALKAADDLLNRGIAQDQLLVVLIEHLRVLMLLKAVPDADQSLIELDEASRAQAAAQAAQFDLTALIHAIALLENIQRSSRHSSTPRALLDAAVARLALSEKFADIAALMAGGGGGSGGEKKKIAAPSGNPPLPAAMVNPGLNPAANTAVSGGTKPAPPAVPALSSAPVSPRTFAPPPKPVAIPSKPAATPVPAASSSPPPPSRPLPQRHVITQEDRDRLLRAPLVRQIIDEFGATLVDIRRQTPDVPAPAPDAGADSTPDESPE